MKFRTIIIFYIFSVYVVFDAENFVWKKIKPFKCKIFHHRKNTIETTTRLRTPDLSTTEPPIFSTTSATTNESFVDNCFSPGGYPISTNLDPNTLNEAMTRAIFRRTIVYFRFVKRMIFKPIMFISPYILHETKLLLFLGSRGRFKSILRDHCGISGNITKIDVLRHYNNAAKIEQERKKKGDESGSYKYISATHFWMDKRHQFRECVLNLFGNEFENIPWTEFNEARMKEWIRNESKGRDKGLDLSYVFDIPKNFALVTYTHFEGLWATHFDEINIRTHPFYGSVTTNTSFMDFTGNFNYVKSEKLGVQILQLPYEGAELSMFILLPLNSNSNNNDDGLHTLSNKLINNVAASSELEKYTKGIQSVATCQVSLPQFKTYSWYTDIYKPNKTDIHDFYDGAENKGDDGIVSYYITLDVNGKVAKRPTINLTPDHSERVQFTANHPFLFFICDVRRKLIIIAGVYKNPSDYDNS